MPPTPNVPDNSGTCKHFPGVSKVEWMGEGGRRSVYGGVGGAFRAQIVQNLQNVAGPKLVQSKMSDHLTPTVVMRVLRCNRVQHFAGRGSRWTAGLFKKIREPRRPSDLTQSVFLAFRERVAEFNLRPGRGVGGKRYPTNFLPSSSSIEARAKNEALRRHGPRIVCLRLSSTLVYLYRCELELAPGLFSLRVAMRFRCQHCRNECRKCEADFE